MTNYVNWMQNNQTIRDGNLPTNGNPVASHESPASGVPTAVAPTGAHYAVVWSTVDTVIEVNEAATINPPDLAAGSTVAWPAGIPFEIPNVIVGVTTIEMTDIV